MRKIWASFGEGNRGRPQVRLTFGFLVMCFVLSLFAARLLQLQAVDPEKYALRAAKESSREVLLPATRGTIYDRNGKELAVSVRGSMIIADPKLTADHAPELARLLARELDLDYFTTLDRLRAPDRRFEYIARRVPTTKATAVLAAAKEAKYKGLSLYDDTLRTYPGEDVAANLIGFLGVDRPLAGLELSFSKTLRGRDGVSSFVRGKEGARVPLAKSTLQPAVDGKDLHTTLDMDLQWYAQRVLRQTIEDADAESGSVVVMDTRTGGLLVLADYPSYDANNPASATTEDRGARSVSDVYEPGSVAKVLTASALIDAGKVTPRTRLLVPGQLPRQDRVIHDWFPHGALKLTLAGVLAKSSNIGTVMAADAFSPRGFRGYLGEFGLGSLTNLGLPAESKGIVPDGAQLTSQAKDRMVFGQSISVTAVQMSAAVNALANGGVYVSPSLIKGSATTVDGRLVGTDTAQVRRVVSASAASQTARMMERVLDPDEGVAPGAAVSGYRVAGKTGTAQRVGEECGCYDGTDTVSFGGFAPADNPRFTVYVVIHNPRNGGGGGSVAGPAFAKVMGYALRRYHVAPTQTAPSRLPVTWS